MNKLYFEEITKQRIDCTDIDTLKAIREEIDNELRERNKEIAIQQFNKFIGALHEMANIAPDWVLFLDRDGSEWTVDDLLYAVSDAEDPEI